MTPLTEHDDPPWDQQDDETCIECGDQCRRGQDYCARCLEPTKRPTWPIESVSGECECCGAMAGDDCREGCER